MADTQLRLEALAAISGRTVKSLTDSQKTYSAKGGANLLQSQHMQPHHMIEILSPDDFLSELTTQRESDICGGARAIPQELFVVVDDFFDPSYDWDFPPTKDGAAESERGGERYSKPWGWKRFALKVLGKYEDGDGWLGRGPDAWPVSYHGTSNKGAEGIIQTHYKSGPGAVYGRGIYSTPDVNVALSYSKSFTSESTKKTYNVILQNRINPKTRQRVDNNYFLVPVPRGTSDVTEKEISKNSIRPYGLLLREVRNTANLKSEQN